MSTTVMRKGAEAYLTASEVGKLLGLCRIHVHRLSRNSKLPARRKCGSSLLFSESEIKEFLKRNGGALPRVRGRRLSANVKSDARRMLKSGVLPSVVAKELGIGIRTAGRLRREIMRG